MASSESISRRKNSLQVIVHSVEIPRGPDSDDSACNTPISKKKNEFTIHVADVLEDLSSPDSDSEEDYPDGGLRAWLVVVGVVCNLFSTIGYASTWGVFQSYYQTDILVGTPRSHLAWIGSIQYSLMFMAALVTGRLFDMGYFHVICIPACIIQVLATFLVAECKTYWQFLLCQGILIGISAGCSVSFTPAIIAHWFKKRREMALGFRAVGSALGGTILPVCARFLIAGVGFKWTMRTFGFIFMVTLGASLLLMKRRLPARKVSGGLINFQSFKSVPYMAFCLSAIVIYLGFYTPLTFIAVTATHIGISQSTAIYFVTIANSSSLAGRFFAGFVSKRIGSWKIIIGNAMVLGSVIYAWPHARTQNTLIAVTVIYGFCTGVYIAVMNTPVIAMGDTADVGRRVGMFSTSVALGALAGPPIAGALSTGPGGFVTTGVYAGSCILAAGGLMMVSRYYLNKKA